MAANAPMICPRCGVEMNHHGDKLVYTTQDRDPEFGEAGAIAEFHACPQCGGGAQRPQ
jgi:ribosomal protein S27AE